MLINHLVNLGHDADGFAEGNDDALIVGDVVSGQGATLAVFEPFFADLIAADVEVPDVFRNPFKALGSVDPDGVVLPGGFLGDGVVTLASEGGDEVVDRRGF